MNIKRFFLSREFFKKKNNLKFITTSEPDENGQYGGFEDVCYEGKRICCSTVRVFGECAFTVYNYEFLADSGEDLNRCAYEIAEDGIPEVLIRKWTPLVYEDIREAVRIFARKNKKIKVYRNLWLDGKYLGLS